MTQVSAAQVTSWISLGTLLCCLCCCAVPGAIAIGVINFTFGEWPLVDARLVDKELCFSTYDNNNDSEEYYLTYNFVTLDGQNITTTTDYCTSITTSSQVRYNPNEPTVILDNTLFNIGRYAARIVTGIGWTFVIISLGLVLWGCTRQEPNDNNNNNTNNTTTAAVTNIELPVQNEYDPERPSYATAVEVPTATTAGGPYVSSASYPVAAATPVDSLKAPAKGPITVYK